MRTRRRGKRSQNFANVICGCSLRRGSTCQRNAIIKSERRTRASRGGRPACGTRVFSVLSFAKLGHVVQNCTCRMIGSGRSVRSGVEYIRGLEAFFQTTSLLQWHGAEMVEDAAVKTTRASVSFRTMAISAQYALNASHDSTISPHKTPFLVAPSENVKIRSLVNK